MDAYSLHKKNLEFEVRRRPNSLIVRYPQLVGRTGNPANLFNFLLGKIRESEHFYVWKYATRNLMDIDDAVVLLANYLNGLDGDQRVREINLANPESYSIMEIIKELEEWLGRKAKYTLSDAGEPYQIDISKARDIIYSSGINFDRDYIKRLIKKYASDRQ